MSTIKEISVLDTCHEAQNYIELSINDIIKQAYKPSPKKTLVEWADENRLLPDNSAEPGQWKTDRVEPAREPMLCISDPDIQEVTVMSCIQLMKTELMNNACFYFMDQEPSPIMYVAPKKELGEAWSKERFTTSINAMPDLRDKLSDNRRDQGNTILQKQFDGGQLSIVSARNPDDLAMRACRVMLFDECDKYPANVGASGGGKDGEGDPIAVAWGRATTFGRRAKKIVACSPTVMGKSRIEREYHAGSQGMFNQPCPSCDKLVPLEWDDVIIPVDKSTGEHLPEESYIRCKHCQHHWTEGDRLRSIKKGQYIHKFPTRKHKSFRATSFSNPFTPVVTLAIEFVKAIGDSQMLKTFYNTRMARTWREHGEQPDWQILYERREGYKMGIIPEGGSMLTMGIDVQKAGIYYEVVAYGRRRVSWSVEKGYMSGDIDDDDFREEIKKLWNRTWKYTNGVETQCHAINIDSGYKSHAVYSLVREFGDQRVKAIKGDQESRLTSILGTPTPVDVDYNGKRIARGLMLWHVGSSVIKEQFYSWLTLKKPTDEALQEGARWPTGYCHYPMYDEEFFKQITAEQRVETTNAKGFTVYAWEKVRKDNHFLDCRVYARAAATMLQIDRMTEENWDKYEIKYSVTNHKNIANRPNSTDTKKQNKPVKKPSFWDR